jgi:hypothetical protein
MTQTFAPIPVATTNGALFRDPPGRDHAAIPATPRRSACAMSAHRVNRLTEQTMTTREPT